jgi:hypothetical protein
VVVVAHGRQADVQVEAEGRLAADPWIHRLRCWLSKKRLARCISSCSSGQSEV